MKKLLLMAVMCVIMSGLVGCDPDDPTRTPNIDLAAESIEFSVQANGFSGTATVRGTVRNIGDNYVSGSEQQGILLYERPLGTAAGSPGNLVAQRDFTNLNAGDTLQVTFTRNWDSSSPAEGEFPPNYILRISFDPDILMDGNPENDDNDSSNNSVEESGSKINDMF